MGSRSDWETMRVTVETLEDLDVRYETRVVSAHRTPDLLFEYASTAAERGLKVIIAGAGGAAHLPGMTAAKTELPVLGRPDRIEGVEGHGLLALDRPDAGRCARGHARDRPGRCRERRVACGGDRCAGRRRGPRSFEAVPRRPRPRTSCRIPIPTTGSRPCASGSSAAASSVACSRSRGTRWTSGARRSIRPAIRRRRRWRRASSAPMTIIRRSHV